MTLLFLRMTLLFHQMTLVFHLMTLCLPLNDPRLPPNDPCLPPNDPYLPANDPPLPPYDPPLPPNDPHLLPNDCPNQLESKLKNSDTDELYTASEPEFLSQTPTSRTLPPESHTLNNEASQRPGVPANQKEESVVASALNFKPSETNPRASQSEQVALPSSGSLWKSHSLKLGRRRKNPTARAALRFKPPTQTQSGLRCIVGYRAGEDGGARALPGCPVTDSRRGAV
ncbi:hypothetical protein Baya_17086 [Bagarius yarrelli]|uniref:Uncharacterized protein n=1 Tax=Bagarius yarrelli TaxID=175774 RepID=A0A556VXE4_BAGYA|nr:hypothetical protein Baya_17086 [Bagarius yarrelli]